MGWFKRIKHGILTPTKEKKETPEGLWYNCPGCSSVVPQDDHIENLWVCQECNHHERVSAENYFDIIFDDQKHCLLQILAKQQKPSYIQQLHQVQCIP